MAKSEVTYAVYRLYYGRDLILKSIDSIIDHVDRVFVFFTGPIANVTHYEHEGIRFKFPEDPDGAKQQVIEAYSGNDKVLCRRWEDGNPRGMFSAFINDLILKSFPNPDAILINEFDHVWKDLPEALQHWREERNHFVSRCSKVEQVELWKPPHADQYWKIPERPDRVGPLLWDMREGPIEQTIFHGQSPLGVNVISGVGGVHNFGYCMAEETMWWKLRTALAYSPVIGDSLPRADFIENVWGCWKPGDRDLEISDKWRSAIPEVEPYPQEEVP